MPECVEVMVGGRTLSIESGRVARQAGGAVVVKQGDTIVLVTAVATGDIREGADFLPLTVDYQEMSYAAGRIPGNFFRREMGRPSDKEILTSRVIDRPIRPLFPKGWNYETQIIATVLSVDQANEPDVLAIVGASAALAVSDIPFLGPIAGVRVGRIAGEFIINPAQVQLAESDIDLVVAGTKDGVVMVEGGAGFVSEEDLLEAIFFAHKAIKPIVEAQEELVRLVGKPKRQAEEVQKDESLVRHIETLVADAMPEVLTTAPKIERQIKRKAMREHVLDGLGEAFIGREREALAVLEELEKKYVRKMVLEDGRRIDGRGFKDVRPISCEVGVLPRTHGSALFTRGETQSLAITTLGTASDEQRIESLAGETFKPFLLHYNFPPFCVGEVRPLRGPGRREIGHGALAERSLSRVIPPSDQFPYTIRVVSEILESNGSSSMATICGASLSLMDAGVPIKAAVAGIAMGLIKEGGKFAVLSDIIGDEDHMGDMDFKVAGTKEGITALQMDIKITGITKEIMHQALKQAREGRLFILERMNEVISEPRTNISEFAPRIFTMKVKPEKIRELIGPGGKMIKYLTMESGVLRIDIDDDGTVKIASPSLEATNKAISMIKAVIQEPEVGHIYQGTVRRIMDFGAFVEILPGVDGLVHISQLDTTRVRNVRDILKEGDQVMVKVLEIDSQGKIRLSRKEALGQSASEAS
jgi:polyribonucleotide nucleotidyltransferase